MSTRERCAVARVTSFPVEHELTGWELFFAELERSDGGSGVEMRERIAGEIRDNLTREALAEHPPVRALRRLFKAAGCDPSRYRPASEALLRRILKGDPIPAIHPLVDLNNCLSASLAVPCCVMAEGTFEPPFVFRRGNDNESYESLRGPFRLAGKPLLVDARGPLDAPITGSERVKVTDATDRATLVAYLPEGVVSSEQAGAALTRIVSGATQ